MNPIELLSQWGLPLVFAAVLAEHGGLPLPAAPLLVGAGALAADGALRPEALLLLAIVASQLADHAWYFLGRRYGGRLLALACRISLSPDTCVRSADNMISRHGPAALLVAKFIPGVSALAIPTAAAHGLGYRRFLVYSSTGAALWAGAYIAAGMIFSREVTAVLDVMSWVGAWAIVVLSALLSVYLAWKIFHRWRLKRLHRLVRITPDELHSLFAEDPEMVVVDARSRAARHADPRMLPRSVTLDDRHPHEVLPRQARERVVVTFCTCPNEESAALVAKRLMDAGYRRVRILTGGEHALARFAVVDDGVEVALTA